VLWHSLERDLLCIGSGIHPLQKGNPGPLFISFLRAGSGNPLDAGSWGKSGLGIALRFAVSSLWLVITTVMGVVLARSTGSYCHTATGLCTENRDADLLFTFRDFDSQQSSAPAHGCNTPLVDYST